MEIEDYQDGLPGNPTLATFTVYLPLGKFRIRRCRLVRLKTGHLKVSLPAYCENPNDRTTKPVYKPYIEFSYEKQKDFEGKVLEALKPYVKGL